jgi:thioredoxin
MKPAEFKNRLRRAPRPVIVDLWAPWCRPCQAMAPAFKAVSQRYEGRVDVWKINADESPEVLQMLKVMGIPTVIAFSKDEEIVRRTGMQTASMLDTLFQSAELRRKPDVLPPAPVDRLIRSIAGLALLALAFFAAPSTLWTVAGAILGAGLLFSAFYDRCPIYRVLAPRVKSFLRREKAGPTAAD